MQKLLISIAIAASLGLAGCSTVGDGLESVSSVTEIIPKALDKAPLVYRPTIQQGDVITQEEVNKLKPGMSKRQVRFVLGSPMLQDVFHDNRWDYSYTLGVGSTPDEIKKFSVYFENDRLVRVTGNWHPEPKSLQKPVEKPAVVSVPNWEPKDKSLFERALSTVGVGGDSDD